MKDLIALLLVAAGVGLFVLPFVTLVFARKARRLTEELDRQVRFLREQQVRGIESHARLTERLERLESAFGVSGARADGMAGHEADCSTTRPLVSPSVVRPPAPCAASAIGSVSEPEFDPAAVAETEPGQLESPRVPPFGSHAMRPSEANPQPTATIDLEQFMGVKLFAWVGGLALFLGIVFFVKLSIERGWISPELRTAIGFVVGAGLVGGGVAMHRRDRYATLAHTLCATGVVVLYGVTFAAHSIWRIAPLDQPLPALALMAFITGAAILLAVRLDAQVVAVLGMLGGFLAPVLCSTGRDNPFGLFGFVVLLDLGVFAVAKSRRWLRLVPLAAGGTLLMQAGWLTKFFHSSQDALGAATWVPVTVFLGFAGLFALAAWWLRQDTRGNVISTSSALALCGSALVAGFAFLQFESIAQRPLVLYTLVLGALALVMLVVWQLPQMAVAQPVFAFLGFLHVCIWTNVALTNHLLPLALGIYVVFGVSHTAFLSAMERRWPTRLPHAGSVLRVTAAVMPFVLLILAAMQLWLPDPLPLFGVTMLFVLWLFGLARFTAITSVVPAALAGVVILHWTWHGENFSLQRPVGPLVWYLGFYAVFTAFPFAFRKFFATRKLPWITSAVAGIGAFSLVYHLVLQTWPNDAMGLLPAAFAIAPLLGVAFVQRHHPVANPARLTQLAWFGGVALLFVTLIFPIQFEKQWITLGWALEGAALCWLFHRVPHPGLRVAGIVLLLAAFVRLALNPAVLDYQVRGETPILNWQLYAYSVAALAMFVAAVSFVPPDNRWEILNLRALCFALGGILLFLLLNIEIADAFTPPGQRSTVFEFGANFARDMTYSIAWALFSLGLLVLGIWRRSAPIRFAGIGLLAVTLLKLFFHDLANIDSGYRIGALIGVAVIALLASFLYQRYFTGATHPPFQKSL